MQGRQKLRLPGSPALVQVQQQVHRLGHRLGHQGVELFVQGDLHQPHPGAQRPLGGHNAGPRHAVAAAHQQKLPLAALVALGIGLPQPQAGAALVQLEDPGAGLLPEGGGHPHPGHHRVPAVLLGGVGAVGGLLPGEGHRGVGPEGPLAHPAGVAVGAAGQVRGDAQAVLAVGKLQQGLHVPGELPPEAEAEDAVHQHLRLSHQPPDPFPVPGQGEAGRLPGQPPQLVEGVFGKVGGGLPLGQHHLAAGPPLLQDPGADKAVPAVVPLAAEHRHPPAS